MYVVSSSTHRASDRDNMIQSCAYSGFPMLPADQEPTERILAELVEVGFDPEKLSLLKTQFQAHEFLRRLVCKDRDAKRARIN